MGNETLISAARAAGFAMAASEEELSMPAARRSGETSADRTADAPVSDAPRPVGHKKAAIPVFGSFVWPFWKTA